MTTTILNGAMAVHHTATVDTPWDGPAAVSGMPNDAAVLKYCHAYVDSNGKPENKSSYSFPHHKTDSGSANLAACRNGLARLSGSNVPASDKPGVERHLKAHLSDGGADADNHDHHHVTGGGQVNKPKEWFTIRNADTSEDGPAQVYIYDQIGDGGWFGGGITAADFVTQLADIKNTAIDLHINSPGGDVFDGVAIYNAIRRHPAIVTSYIDGLAASAASFIAQAGNTVVIEPNAQFMVHDASGLCYGNAADMGKMMDLLNKASDNIASIYAQRTGVDQSTWRDVMKEEAWYSASESVLAGLADSVAPEPVTTDARLTNRARFDLKALGARYGSRQEAPEPPLPPMRLAAATRDPAAEVPEPVLPVTSAVEGTERPATRTEADVTVELAPARALSAFELAVLDVVARGMQTQVPPPAAEVPAEPPAVAVIEPEPQPVMHETTERPFDPAAFRTAVRLAVARTR